jgi:hypothetical protein
VVEEPRSGVSKPPSVGLAQVVEEPRSGVSKPPSVALAQVVEERRAERDVSKPPPRPLAQVVEEPPSGVSSAALPAQVVEERTAGGGTRLETAAATRG